MSLDTSFDIKNIICLYIYDLKNITNLYNLNKDHQSNIIITNLYDILQKYRNRLNQQIIEQNKYKNVEKLNVNDNEKIENVNDNEKIENVNHMKETQVVYDGQKLCLLKILHCGNNCGINQNGITKLNLIELNANGNKKITNVNHMKNTQVASDGHKSSACQKYYIVVMKVELIKMVYQN